MNPWKEFKKDVLKSLKLALNKLDWPSRELKETLEEPPESTLGDMATTICFELPKELNKPPSEIAEELSNKVDNTGMVREVKPVGGYVNFFVDESKLTSLTLNTIEETEAGYGIHGEMKGKVIIEHTSVNPTKPLHIGHGRNAVLGDTMARILRALGHEVEVQNYIDDLGLQVAQTILAYQIIDDKTEDKFDHVLGKLYVDMHERMPLEPDLEYKAREILSKLEKGKGDIVKKAREISDKCVRANLETTDRLNINYNLLVWESDITNSGALEETLKELKKTPYFIRGKGRHKGTFILRLKEFGLDDKVMIRSDGTTVYTARDLAYQLWKFGRVKADLRFKKHSERPNGLKTYTTNPSGTTDHDFANADIVINVIGTEQKFPQKIISTALKSLGLEKEFEKSYHLAYEHVRLPSKKFAGRKGTWIGYTVDEVIEEAVDRAKKEVEKRNPEADAKFMKESADAVGIGAVRFALIRTSPEKEVVFKWGEALNFERNSGPAIQYSHARACSILRKLKKTKIQRDNEVLKEPEEYALLKCLSKFPEVVRIAGEEFQPYLLAVYASELALIFNKFYEVAPVIKAETEELKATRIRLVNCTRIVLSNALNLLGIKAPERM